MITLITEPAEQPTMFPRSRPRTRFAAHRNVVPRCWYYVLLLQVRSCCYCTSISVLDEVWRLIDRVRNKEMSKEIVTVLNIVVALRKEYVYYLCRVMKSLTLLLYGKNTFEQNNKGSWWEFSLLHCWWFVLVDRVRLYNGWRMKRATKLHQDSYEVWMIIINSLTSQLTPCDF